MAGKIVHVLSLLAIFVAASSLPLPSYLRKCKLSDPKLSECAYKIAKEALPKLLNGDKKYNIPDLDPLRVTDITIGTPGNGQLVIRLKDIDLIGLDDVVLKDLTLDKDLNLVAHVLLPKCRIKGRYDIDGKVLILPIKGEGDVDLNLENVDVEYKVVLTKTKNKGDGLEYFKPKDGKLTFTTTHASIQMDNLFNGDKALGDNMNKFLNDNWKDVVDELGPDVSQAIVQIIAAIIDGALKQVPAPEVID